MQQAIDLATENVTSGRGGPFGAVIVKNGEVVATGANCVTSSNDPTAHAEVTAIRNACTLLATFDLQGCEIYTSCEPCPMCLAAILWSRIGKIYYGNGAAEAAKIGFDDAAFYEQLRLPIEEREVPMHRLLPEEAWESFAAWDKSPFKVEY